MLVGFTLTTGRSNLFRCTSRMHLVPGLGWRMSFAVNLSAASPLSSNHRLVYPCNRLILIEDRKIRSRNSLRTLSRSGSSFRHCLNTTSPNLIRILDHLPIYWSCSLRHLRFPKSESLQLLRSMVIFPSTSSYLSHFTVVWLATPSLGKLPAELLNALTSKCVSSNQEDIDTVAHLTIATSRSQQNLGGHNAILAEAFRILLKNNPVYGIAGQQHSCVENSHQS